MGEGYLMQLTVLVAFIALLGGIQLILAAVTFDKAVMRLWKSSHDEWVNLGCPSGFFRQPNGSQKGFSGIVARQQAISTMLFSSDLPNDTDTRKLAIALRCQATVFVLIVFVMIGLALLFG